MTRKPCKRRTPKKNAPSVSMNLDSSKFAVSTNGKVTYLGFYTFTRDGKVIGTLDATFDFSGLPDELHLAAADRILQGARTCPMRSTKEGP